MASLCRSVGISVASVPSCPSASVIGSCSVGSSATPLASSRLNMLSPSLERRVNAFCPRASKVLASVPDLSRRERRPLAGTGGLGGRQRQTPRGRAWMARLPPQGLNHRSSGVTVAHGFSDGAAKSLAIRLVAFEVSPNRLEHPPAVISPLSWPDDGKESPLLIG